MPSVRVLARDDHGRRVPADVGPDAALLVLVAGEPGFGVGRDGVDVGGRDRGREVDLLGAGPLQELHEQVARPGPAPGVDDGVERVEPLLRLARIRVGNLVADPVEQHCSNGTGRRGTPLTTGRGCYTFVHALPRARPVVVYTDGACRGNPGPGGWAWAVPGGPYASGAEAHTTNQRMEITAALEALRALTPDAPAGDRGGERLDLRRQVLHRPLVAGLAAPELEELAEQAGGQPRPVGAADRARASRRVAGHLPLGQGPLGRPLERPGRRAGHRWRPIRGAATSG